MKTVTTMAKLHSNEFIKKNIYYTIEYVPVRVNVVAARILFRRHGSSLFGTQLTSLVICLYCTSSPQCLNKINKQVNELHSAKEIYGV